MSCAGLCGCLAAAILVPWLNEASRNYKSITFHECCVLGVSSHGEFASLVSAYSTSSIHSFLKPGAILCCNMVINLSIAGGSDLFWR